MMRILHVGAAALAGALFIHLLIIALVPHVLRGRSHDALTGLTASGDAIIVPGADAAARFAGADPYFDIRICPFELSQGPMRITSRGAALFHTVTIVNDRDEIEFAIIDRLQVGKNIDLEILPESDRDRYRFRTETGLSDPGDTIPVFTKRTSGHVIIRAFNPDAATAPKVRTFLEDVACQVAAFGS
jgi:uncharacterized membrane protein